MSLHPHSVPVSRNFPERIDPAEALGLLFLLVLLLVV